MARLFEKERMGLLLLSEETDPHLINNQALPSAHLSGSRAAAGARNLLGDRAEHRKVEKGQVKEKISPYQHRKKKAAAGLGQGNCSFEGNRTAFTS